MSIYLELLVKGFCIAYKVDPEKIGVEILPDNACVMYYKWGGEEVYGIKMQHIRNEYVGLNRVRIHGLVDGMTCSVEAMQVWQDPDIEISKN